VQADGSAFFRGEAEVMLLRLPEHGFDGYAFLDVSETRYFSADTTDHERSAFLTSEVRWQASEKLKLGLQAQGYHHDQVFDVSVSEAEINSALLKVTGATLSPSVRWGFSGDWWTEVRGTGRKDHYAENIDGYKEGEGSARIGRSWGYGSEWSVMGLRRWRAHDTRELYTAAGRPIAGSHLKVQQNEYAVNFNFVPDKKKSWRGTLTALREENRDNGSGYFDFTKQQLTAGLTWKNSVWELHGTASAAHYDFPVQKVGIGIAPENRHKNEYGLTVEATRRLTAAWSVVACYETERALSNDDRSRFRINTGYIGLKWSWDNLGLERNPEK
jgi:hypothetical protein